MGLVDGVGILIAELLEDVVDTLVVLCADEFANDALKTTGGG